jgi:O-antigen/teichoic acid export membrane protein
VSVLKGIASGAAWSAGSQWAIQLAQFGVSIFVARLLCPQDYGLVSMSAVFIGFVSLFSNLGFGPALVQRKEIEDEHVSTAFWATAGVSCLLFLGAVSFASLVASFFGEKQLVSIVRISSIAFLLSPLNIILSSLLMRRMAFRELAITDMVASVSSQITTLCAALTGFGVWSLVLGSLVYQVVRMPILFMQNRWLPAFRFNMRCFNDLFSFGGYMMGFNFLNYFARNLDNIIIGKLLGVTALGYYDLAYQIMLKPLSNVSQTLTKPLFPALASLQDDKVLARETYRTVVVYISLITFPMLLGLAVVAPEFIQGVLGDKWAPSINVLRILCLVGAIQSIGSTVGDVFLSQGRADIQLKWAIATTPLLVVAFIAGTHWGIEGVALCYAVVIFLLWGIQHGIANRLLALKATRFWSALIPAFRYSLIMVAAVIAVQYWLNTMISQNLLKLCILVTVGLVVYIPLVLSDSAPELGKIRLFIRNLFSQYRHSHNL